MEEPRLDVLFYVSDNRVGGDYIMGKVGRLERSGEILGAYYGKIIMNKYHSGFFV